MTVVGLSRKGLQGTDMYGSSPKGKTVSMSRKTKGGKSEVFRGGSPVGGGGSSSGSGGAMPIAP